MPPVRSCRRGGCSVPPHTQCRVGYCVDHCTSARCTRNRRPSVRPPPHQQTPTPQHPTTRNRASRVDAVHNPSPQGAAAPGPSASDRPPLVARAPPVGSPRLLPLLQSHRPSRVLAADVVALSLCISSAPQVSATCTVDLAGVRSTTIRRETAGVRRCGRARREPLSPSTSLASTPLDGLCPTEHPSLVVLIGRGSRGLPWLGQNTHSLIGWRGLCSRNLHAAVPLPSWRPTLPVRWA